MSIGLGPILHEKHNHMHNPNMERSKQAFKIVNPQAGLGFDLAGADLHHLYIGSPPRFGSAEKALSTFGH
jgi:hypothetical protein